MNSVVNYELRTPSPINRLPNKNQTQVKSKKPN